MTRFYRYFFTRSEMRGILILSAGVIFIRLLSFYIVPADPLPGQGAVPAGQTMEPAGRAGQAVKRIEINTADSTLLETLPGIGPSFARRIIRYREMLGGYSDKSQLLEVYGMDTIRLNGFIARIRVDASSIRKMNINTATFRQLLSHPYLDYEKVKAVVRFRDRKGTFRSPDELWAKGVLPDSLKRKLEPYLTAAVDSVGGKEGVLEK
jgi:competence protein ComEA